MESRLCIFLLNKAAAALITGAILTCNSVFADDISYPGQEPVIEPELERRSITSAEIDSEDFEVGVFAGVMSVEDFGTNLVYGARAAYHITEDLFVEAAYGRTDTDKTSFEKLSGGAQLIAGNDRTLTYYNISLGYNLFPGEVFIGEKYAFNSALYLIAGVGSTDFADEKNFTVNFGAGYRLLLTDWLALHIDGRDHTYETDILGDNERKHNLEFHGGVTFFF